MKWSLYSVNAIGVLLLHGTSGQTENNTCFETSDLGGCSDQVCLAAVCASNSLCCESQYDMDCVERARVTVDSCAAPDPTNLCDEESVTGGCSTVTCADSICLADKSCCNNETRTGAWTEVCVKIAEAVCIPMVLSRVFPDESCPLGFTCNEESMANCSEIRSAARDLYLVGDVYAGIYCGKGGDTVQNCKQGSYCPTPEEKIPCPAGFFCPHKTAKPELVCKSCGEAATEIVRDPYGYAIISLFFLLCIVAIACVIIRRYNKELITHLYELQQRQTDSVKLFINRQKRQQRVERIAPKLDLISRRLEATAAKEGSGTLSSSKFDARRLFDALNTDGDDVVSFSELNVILELKGVELQEFVRRMNELAGVSEEMKSVTRSVFVRYFLQVLEETSYITCSAEEAGVLFDEMADNNQKKMAEIPLNKFFDSSMTNFLSDGQINELIKKFRTSKRDGPSSSRRSSLHLLRRAPSSALFGKALRVNETTVTKSEFVLKYPQFLISVTTEYDRDVQLPIMDDEKSELDSQGVDICFQGLSLSIKVGEKSVDVVDHVTGRVEAKTMTALMGGSGAGKTSLLNALCGRAFYGEVTGSIHVNGHPTSIEDHRDAVGFVPQDDIVYAELSVRENLIFSGKFRLPKGTSDEAIADLADKTLASLGLSRVANSLVGDVKRRGVSGGEKKRVNIGLELMALPSILFLDEPTSGLDSSSALLVMQSLKRLVDVNDVTVVSVIHQPRKFIFDLFDSLILLGVGGRMVYHGPTKTAQSYFEAFNYVLPLGESVADWLIDISSGRLEPDSNILATRVVEENSNAEDASEVEVEALYTNSEEKPILIETNEDEKKKSKKKKKKKRKTDPQQTRQPEEPPGRCIEGQGPGLGIVGIVGATGITTGKVDQVHEDAKERRAWLNEEWNNYFSALSGPDKRVYEVPEPYELPRSIEKPSFLYQLKYQTVRALLVAWRNGFSKFVDAVIIVGAVLIITFIDGVAKITSEKHPNIPFEDMVRPRSDSVESIFKELFKYAISNQMQYPLKVGIILAVLLSLTATKIISAKRIEFFREAGSGYNLNAYFVAVNIVASLEHSIQAFIAASFAVWIRNPVANGFSYFVHFLLLSYICVSWALLVPMVVPPENVVLVIGFFVAFFGLLFSGAFPPIMYPEIYENRSTEIFCGWLSPTRYFFEALVVGEYRCLPEQSGFTIEDHALNRKVEDTVFWTLGYARHDIGNVIQKSCSGWYWSVLPIIGIGLTVRFIALGAMHAFYRSLQTKKSLLFVMKKDRRAFRDVILYVVVLCFLFGVTTWLMIRDVPYERQVNPFLDFTQNDVEAIVGSLTLP